MIVVNDNLQCAGIIIPKVASSSIRGALAGRHVDSIPAGYFTFAFVRHPFDRLVSALYSVFRAFGDQDERLSLFLDRPEHLIDSHARPQVVFLRDRRVDFLGRFEHLARDWAKLQQHVPLPPLAHLNAGLHRPARWQEAPVTWERWRPIYAEDFRLCRDWQ